MEISKDNLPDSVKKLIGDDEFVIETFCPDQDPALTEAFGMDPVEREIMKLQSQYQMRKAVDELNKVRFPKKYKKRKTSKKHSVLDELKNL